MTKEGFLTKEELLAEEHICNGKCQDDITKNYVHCKTCTRIKDFLAGYKTGFETCAKARLNVTTISDCPIKDDELKDENKVMADNYSKMEQKFYVRLSKAKELLSFWVNDFHDGFNHSIKYEEKHKALVESEQFISEVEV